MRIEVTEEDAVGAKPGCTWRCLVARALRRLTGQRWHVSDASAWADGESFALPPEAQWLINHYDRGHRVALPFVFELPLPGKD